MDTTTSSPALLLRLEALRPSMSPAEKQVVDYILKSPEEVIHLSVSGLAENSGVSDATVVRTCRNIGFDGYQDFKVTLAQDIVTPLQSIHEEIDYKDSVEVVIDKVFQGAFHTLNFTHDTIKASSIENAANSIINAKRICVVGQGNSHAIAVDLQHKLLRLGLNVIAYADSHLQTIAITYLSENDVLFCISHSGSSVDVIEDAKLAKKNGAIVISLTNIGSSPLSKISDINLFTASKETKYRIVALNSRIAQLAIIDTIYTLIAIRLPESSENFHRIEKALETKKI